MTQATNNYHIVWYSPSGFANEGAYLVGTDKGLAAYQNRYFDDDGTSSWCALGFMGTRAEMEDAAESLCASKARSCRADNASYWSIGFALIDSDGDICR